MSYRYLFAVIALSAALGLNACQQESQGGGLNPYGQGGQPSSSGTGGGMSSGSSGGSGSMSSGGGGMR